VGPDAVTPLVTGAGVFGVLVAVIVYLVSQNWKLTQRLSEVQDQQARSAEDRTERAAARIAELEALLRVTAPHVDRGSG
jgi:heme exporter protein D